jgi:hypothetical protein
VEQNVGVRMAGESGRMVDFNAAEDELSAPLEAVHVEAVAYAESVQ